jgi:WhiB family redox-sensing transcriptional regulator
MGLYGNFLLDSGVVHVSDAGGWDMIPAKEIQMDTSWMARGNCATHPPSTFFPSDGVGVEVARRVCDGCPVENMCLEYALRNRIDHGVWGGCSERQRRRILKARRADALAG